MSACSVHYLHSISGITHRNRPRQLLDTSNPIHLLIAQSSCYATLRHAVWPVDSVIEQTQTNGFDDSQVSYSSTDLEAFETGVHVLLLLFPLTTNISWPLSPCPPPTAFQVWNSLVLQPSLCHVWSEAHGRRSRQNVTCAAWQGSNAGMMVSTRKQNKPCSSALSIRKSVPWDGTTGSRVHETPLRRTLCLRLA
jgi:hypothetical protein